MISKPTYKIAVVDDETLFLEGLKLLINSHEQLTTHIMSTGGKDLLAQLNASPDDLPNVLLCDIEMPGMNGIELTKKMQADYPQIKIIVLSTHYDSELILKMMEIGASAFMPKNEESDEFYKTIISVVEKGFYYNDFVVKLIREKMLFGPKSKVVDLVKLTNREKEILVLICKEKTNIEIAEFLSISPRTVGGHRNKMLEKTGSKNTAGLIVYAIERGYYEINLRNNEW